MVRARNSVTSKIDRVGPERDRGAGAAARRVAVDGRASSLGLPPSANSMLVALAVAVDLDDQPARRAR